MGKQQHIGFVQTECYGAVVLFRVDTPGAPDREYVLEAPQFARTLDGNSQYCPKGATVRRVARPAVSVLIGAASIYRMTPCTEEVALRAIEREQRGELMLVKLPETAALPSASELFESNLQRLHKPLTLDETCEECGRRHTECECV